jgi:hypothetical protein
MQNYSRLETTWSKSKSKHRFYELGINFRDLNSWWNRAYSGLLLLQEKEKIINAIKGSNEDSMI